MSVSRNALMMWKYVLFTNILSPHFSSLNPNPGLSPQLRQIRSPKVNVSPTVEGAIKEKFMTYPRALMYAQNREVATVVTEETGLLEEPSYEYHSSPDQKCEEKLNMWPISIKCVYESPNVIKPLKESALLVTVTGEVTMPVTTDPHLKKMVTTLHARPCTRAINCC